VPAARRGSRDAIGPTQGAHAGSVSGPGVRFSGDAGSSADARGGGTDGSNKGLPRSKSFFAAQELLLAMSGEVEDPHGRDTDPDSDADWLMGRLPMPGRGVSHGTGAPPVYAADSELHALAMRVGLGGGSSAGTGTHGAASAGGVGSGAYGSPGGGAGGVGLRSPPAVPGKYHGTGALHAAFGGLPNRSPAGHSPMSVGSGSGTPGGGTGSLTGTPTSQSGTPVLVRGDRLREGSVLGASGDWIGQNKRVEVIRQGGAM
jgi:hypothetical protein